MYKSMRCIGGWCITLGVISLVTGLCVGVGCIVAGGNVLSISKKSLL